MSKNSIENITHTYLEKIEDELQQAVRRAKESSQTRLYDLLSYHMGWEGNLVNTDSRGKRIRPLLVLLSCSAAGGNWHNALPGAAAVELIHNFSLIHDDIEDGSPLRRGRPTVWKKWGIPQAINTGDAMFALAHIEAVRLSETVSPTIAIKAVELLQRTCLHLTQGQYLDLAYETRDDLTVDDYWVMVEGKTAALIAASTELGAMAAFKNDQECERYREFGRLLGLAFQIQDDLLGIWGNSSLTGKSNLSDLVTGKITLPILYGVSKAGRFAARWKKGPIQPDEVGEIIHLLEIDDGKIFAQTQATKLLNEALAILNQVNPQGIEGEALKNLAITLINRES